jgi:hypothetical protein
MFLPNNDTTLFSFSFYIFAIIHLTDNKSQYCRKKRGVKLCSVIFEGWDEVLMELCWEVVKSINKRRCSVMVNLIQKK